MALTAAPSPAATSASGAIAARWGRWVVGALVAWTFLVWTTRIGNIWNDDALETAGKVGRTALALSFTTLALAVVVAWWRRPALLRPAVLALGAWSTAVWLVRGTTILLDDHDTAFTVVHEVLAVVSIALSVAAERATRRAPAPTGEPVAT
ncbi:MAG TPA: hypothetical protein VIL36_13365 [Acidimicrobiales bacterium]